MDPLPPGVLPSSRSAQLWGSLAFQQESLISQQNEIFQRTIERNEKLEEEVVELKRDLQVWKKAYSECAAESDRRVEEATALRKKVAELEGLKDQGPILLALIDGDGNIFQKNLLKLGLHGGRQAAQRLTESIIAYVREQDQSGARAQLWVYIFFNMKGLKHALIGGDICTADEFEAFVTGFNQANPRFTINDVHSGKEAADVKIKEYLLSYTRFPQTSRIFFGGGHDNGYLPTLTELQSEGLLNKIVLLKGYRDVAAELQTLRLPTLRIESLFMSEKIYVRKPSGPPSPNSPLSAGRESSAISYSKVVETGIEALGRRLQIVRPSLTISSTSGTRFPNPHMELHKNVPPPCNLFYLARCINGANCQFGHDYILSPEHYDTLRTNARKAPCPAVKKNLPCALGEDCPLGHKCPAGPECEHLPRGKCRFKGGKSS